MCDYSLHGVATRPARVGDKLVTTQFWNTTTRGFSALEEPRVAVCLLPGTEVAFENKVERHLTGFQLLFRRTKPLPHRVARFRQVNVDNPCTHHDALEFPDGQIVLLTHLREGQRATVLQLPAQPKPMPPSRLCPKSVVFLSGIATRRQVERCHVKTRDTGSGRGRRSAIGARSGLQSTTRFVLLGNNRAPPRGIPLRPDRLPSATPPMSARSDAP
jgi:hypothetical protein